MNAELRQRAVAGRSHMDIFNALPRTYLRRQTRNAGICSIAHFWQQDRDVETKLLSHLEVAPISGEVLNLLET
ncbi:hypothetical protein D3C83_174630 [compost metagenome]